MNNQISTSLNQSQDSDRHIRRIQRLFAKLTAMYGETFRRNLGNDQQAQLIMAEWTDQLVDYTDEQLKRGLDNLEGNFPPSLPEFKKLCLTDRFNTHWQQKTAAYRLPTKEEMATRLPSPEKMASKDRVQAEIQKAKSIIRGKNNECNQ